MLSQAGAAKKAAHRDVVSVHARPLSRLTIPADAEERKSAATLIRFREGIFIDYLQSLGDQGKDKILHLMDRDIKQHDLFVFSQSIGASDRLLGQCKGLNACHPLLFGIKNSKCGNKTLAAAQNNQCGICEVQLYVGEGRRLVKNPLKGKVDWSTADIICRRCYHKLSRGNWLLLQWAVNGAATGLQDLADRMSMGTAINANTHVHDFEADAQRLGDCPTCERPFHHRPAGQSLVTLRKTDNQMPRSPSLPFSAWPCMGDITVTCHRCHLMMYRLAISASGDAVESETSTACSKFVQEIQEGCSLQRLKAFIAERASRKGLNARNAARVELQNVAAQVGQCDVCKRRFSFRPEGMSLDQARKLDDRIAYPLQDSVKAWACLKDIRAVCTVCSMAINRGPREGPASKKPTSYGRAIMAAVKAGCDFAGLLHIISPKLKFD